MDEQTEEKKENGLKAKTVSLLAKIVVSELCTVAGTFAALFVTIDANIALDKFKKVTSD